MVWQKIDDQFGISQKVIRIPRRRRHQCIGLWTLAGNYSVRALTDGVLEEHELDELDARAVDVAELVRVGLWHARPHSCESCPSAPVGGIVIHDFLNYNPSRMRVLTDREAERVRKAAQRDKKRSPSGTPNGTPGGRGAASEHPVPIPSRPDPLDDITTVSESSHLGDVEASQPEISGVVAAKAKQAGIKDLDAVHWLLERECGLITLDGVVELVNAITARAKGAVRDVDAYVATACRNTPDEVRFDYDRLDLAVAS